MSDEKFIEKNNNSIISKYLLDKQKILFLLKFRQTLLKTKLFRIQLIKQILNFENTSLH